MFGRSSAMCSSHERWRRVHHAESLPFWAGAASTLADNAAKLKESAPAAATELEQRYQVAADFELQRRVSNLVDDLDARIGPRAAVQRAAGTAPTYVVTGVLMLFLLILECGSSGWDAPSSATSEGVVASSPRRPAGCAPRRTCGRGRCSDRWRCIWRWSRSRRVGALRSRWRLLGRRLAGSRPYRMCTPRG
jgi:hypothetical protein